MVLRMFLGMGNQPTPPGGKPAATETETVRRIIRELEQLEPEQSMYLAGFAYILTRAAHADLNVSADESALMEQIVSKIGGLPEAQSVLVVEIARRQSELYGGTEDYLVTREFAARATDDQKRATVAACFAVAAADHLITAEEYTELSQIADELDLSRAELNVIRREYVDQLAAIQQMRGERG